MKQQVICLTKLQKQCWIENSMKPIENNGRGSGKTFIQKLLKRRNKLGGLRVKWIFNVNNT